MLLTPVTLSCCHLQNVCEIQKVSEKQDKLAEKQDKLAEEQRKTTKALQKLEMMLTKREEKLTEEKERLAAERKELDLEKKRTANDAQLDGFNGWNAADQEQMQGCRVQNRIYKDNVRGELAMQKITNKAKKKVCATF